MSFFIYILLAYGLTFYAFGIIGLALLAIVDFAYINQCIKYRKHDTGRHLLLTIKSKPVSISEPLYAFTIFLGCIALLF
jgi:hypothetical protein